MLVQVTNINSTQLNSGTAFTFDVSKPILQMNNQNYFYNTRQIKAKNGTGAKLYFLPLTEREYDKYQLDNTISDMLPLASNEEIFIEEIFGSVTKVLVKGTTGHSNSLDFILFKRGV